MEPDCRRGHRHKSHAHNIRNFKAMLMVLLVFISVLVVRRVGVRLISMLMPMFVPVFRFDFRVLVSERHIRLPFASSLETQLK